MGLEKRVQRLEKQNRLLTIFLAIVICGGALMGFIRNDDEIVDVIKARSLEIYSADDKRIVLLEFDKWTEGGAITLFDQEGERRTWWRANPQGAHLYLDGMDDEEEEIRSALILSSNSGHTSLGMYGGTGRASFVAAKGASPALRIYSDGDSPIFTTQNHDHDAK